MALRFNRVKIERDKHFIGQARIFVSYWVIF